MSAPTRNHYLYFSRKERRGILVLIVLILLLCAIPFLLPLILKEEVVEKTNLDQPLAALKKKQVTSKNKTGQRKEDHDNDRPYDEPFQQNDRYRSSPKGILFSFDPNSLDEAGWKKLGLRDKTIATIINFRNKGGRFRQPADIKKIWGLQPEEAERLIPYIQIASAAGKDQKNYSNVFENKPSPRKKYSIIEINTADSTVWIGLPGIGSKLSQRIIHFRDKLGGFYNIEQVAETFALPDSTYQQIKPFLQASAPVKKININTVELNELKQHPYIKYNLANVILQYRKQHGNFSSVSDLKKIMIVDDALYDKLFPYLSVE